MENYFRRRGVWQVRASGMTIEISLALIAASAPLTAILLVYLPRKVVPDDRHVTNGKNGKHITVREYDKDMGNLGNKLVGIDSRLDALDTRMRDLTIAVNQHPE